ncbi:MAG: Crp/Fnr family transcriptional regulator [Bacteroidetes bacterium]|nr:Crp/Fnr family transcriptional regulator [Bacteroidota bacterium]
MNLEQCLGCGKISKKEREEYFNSLDAIIKNYKKGDYIARQGDMVDYLYILSEGSVKTEMITESGGILGVETIVAPRPLAPAFLFADNNRFPVDVIASKECEVALISKESVMKQLSTNESFFKSYMAFNANRTHFLSERLQLLSIKTIKGKLAYYILQRAKNGLFDLELNQKELAEYFGVARPSIARSFSEMVEEEVITSDGKILNNDKLKNYILS